MKLSPILNFNGDCEAAFRFYQERLGATPVSLNTWGDSPAAAYVPAEWSAKIIHGSIELDGQLVMGSDSPPGRYEKPVGITVSIGTKEPSEAVRLYRSLAENGEILMPLGPTFFAHQAGMVRDQFGIPWMLVCAREDWEEEAIEPGGCGI